MIVFLIPVRHESGVENYEKLWLLLNHTLASVAAQDCDDWHVVVVANKVLPIHASLPSRKITFIEYKRRFQGKALIRWNEEEFQRHIVDKALRRRTGIVWVRQQLSPTWYFMLDADDYVSNDLVSTIVSTTEPKHSMVTVDSGLVVSLRHQTYYATSEFNTMCGSSVALRAPWVHHELENEDVIYTLLAQHRHKYFKGILPMYARHSLYGHPRAAYLQHNQNHGRAIWGYEKGLDKMTPLTDKIRAKFQIPGNLGLTDAPGVLQ